MYSHYFVVSRHATLVLEHEKKSKSWGNRRDANARTESTEFLTTSLERDGCAMSDVSSFHTQSTLSDLQPSVRLSATAQVKSFDTHKVNLSSPYKLLRLPQGLVACMLGIRSAFTSVVKC